MSLTSSRLSLSVVAILSLFCLFQLQQRNMLQNNNNNNKIQRDLLVVNSSSTTTTNHFPRQNQNHQIHDKDMNHMATAHTTTATTTGGKFPIPKPTTTTSQISQEQQQALKCPRCDSSNTKFCYYNNYSLSQPRHFCKACKRYWTRGGTLRNVPVGGGCRKNKRIRRPNASNNSTNSTTTSFSAIHDHNPPSTSIMNPLFYGLPNNSHDLNVQFSGGGYDQNHQMSGFGLGFSSGLGLNDEYQNGYTSNLQLSNYASMFGSSPSIANTITTSSASPTTGINSSFNFKTLFPYQNMQIGSSLNGDQEHDETNGVKLEEEKQYRFGFGTTASSDLNNHHQIHQIGFSADNPSYLNNSNAYWSTTDLSNIGSSVTSLL